MEKADNVFVIPSEFGWSDLGTWTSLHEKLERDRNANSVVHGPVELHDCEGCLVHTVEGKMVVASDLKDMVVISEDDVVLIFPKDKEQEIKQIRQALENKGLGTYL